MNEIDYKALRRRVQTDLQRQKSLTRWILFVVSLLMYVLFIILGWGIYFANGGAAIVPNIPGVSRSDPITSAMMLMTVSGGLGVMFQFISALLDTRLGEAKMRDQIMGRLVAEEIMRLGEEDEGQEKAKRALRLSDEGELEDIVDESEVASLREQYNTAKK